MYVLNVTITLCILKALYYISYLHFMCIVSAPVVPVNGSTTIPGAIVPPIATSVTTTTSATLPVISHHVQVIVEHTEIKLPSTINNKQ